MSAQILSGTKLSKQIQQQISKDIKQLIDNGKARPRLDVILVGENKASQTYVKHKQQACKNVGITSICHKLCANTTENQLSKLIAELNNNDDTSGILLQLPLPSHLEPNKFIELINPNKDVDGFHPISMGRLATKQPIMRPCTPYGVLKLLEQTNINMNGLHVVIIGASNIVGRPMALECLMLNCTVTVCHSATTDLKQHISHADILITAIGNPNVIKSDWIKPGAIVIDVGFNHLADGSIRGDIDFNTAKERASWITPVPGGVGPMTIAMLLQNTLLAATLNCHPHT